MFIENDSFTVYGTEFPYCEYPKKELVFRSVPKAFPSVSIVSGYSDAENAALNEIAAEIGDEISALYESMANESEPFYEDSEIEPLYVLAGMAGDIADKVRARNAANIASIVESPLYPVGMELVRAFGIGKNVLVSMNDTESFDLYAVKSNLKKGIDEMELIGRIRNSGAGIVFNAAMGNGDFSADIRYSSPARFAAVMESIIPNRVNKIRDDSFRNGKGARSKGKNFGIANKTAEKAIAAIAKDEDAAIIEKAAEFGYFPLPNFQGKTDISAEDIKARATMKKRNQRAKKKAIEAMDAKRIEIMEMIDAIAERQIESKPFAKANKDVQRTALFGPKTIENTIQKRNAKAKESVEIIDHEKMNAELDARLAEYARKAKAKAKVKA